MVQTLALASLVLLPSLGQSFHNPSTGRGLSRGLSEEEFRGLLFFRVVPSAIGYCAPAYDGNGNMAALVSLSGGTNCATYEYGPFGELLRATGPMAKLNPFRFSTKCQDDETDLLYYGYRYLNASTGRWVSRDPITEAGGPSLEGFDITASSEATSGPSLDCFVTNDPVDLFDVLGLIDYRFEPVVGELAGGLPKGAGRWGQPLTYADGSATASSTSAYTFEKVWSGPAPAGSCNTVYFQGLAYESAGAINVYAQDRCPGRYRLSFTLTYEITTTGPHGNALLKVYDSPYSVVFRKAFINQAVHYKKTESIVIEADVPEKVWYSRGKRVLRYEPTISFPRESVYKKSTGSVDAEVMAGPATRIN